MLLAKARYGSVDKNSAGHTLRFFGRVMDKRKIKSLHFLEYGRSKNIIKSKVSQFNIDMILINPYNNKKKKLCAYLSQNLKATKVVPVNFFVPSDDSLVPKPIDNKAPLPLSKGPLSSSYAHGDIRMPVGTGIPLTASKSAYSIPDQQMQADTSSSTRQTIHEAPPGVMLAREYGGEGSSTSHPNIEEDYNYRMTYPRRKSHTTEDNIDLKTLPSTTTTTTSSSSLARSTQGELISRQAPSTKPVLKAEFQSPNVMRTGRRVTNVSFASPPIISSNS
ncbi:hypothetical protein SAMD00019534_007520 [Acytostelium subglobosum LB1]|uniref:hypothetical protein n=1 Tax=Acytostelium subglobosum LB1 TaxID=1410327 RepID=UPI000644D005|nr:hypothetical protein SAMD00019534_007520 [Acytostelium subglobosum LB1]GAM17577.1 hypothetical protein SAMD00019534_007520 [Acytostelium subglobosum LB1]|eukprot:XP_012759639.1 hypothetical protein SAMD00019534_007520 [Acytostelium subglobosum LB1]